MRLIINGDARDVDAADVDALLGQLSLDKGQVAVEVNGVLVKRAARGQMLLQDGDTIEIVTLVGGG